MGDTMEIYHASAGLRVFLSFLPFLGAPFLASVLAFEAIDFIDGIFVRLKSLSWGKLVKGYAGKLRDRLHWRYRWRDYLVDTFRVVFFLYALIEGIWSQFAPYFVLVIFLFPLMQVFAWYGKPLKAFKPSTGLFLLAMSLGTLVGANLLPVGVTAMAINPVLEVALHGADWGISGSKVVYPGLASALWLLVGVVITGYFHPLLVAVPLFVLIATKEIQGARR